MLLGSTTPFQTFRRCLIILSMMPTSLVPTSKSLFVFWVNQKILSHFDAFFSLIPSSDQISLFYLPYFLNCSFLFHPWHYRNIISSFLPELLEVFLTWSLCVLTYIFQINPQTSCQNGFFKRKIISYYFLSQNLTMAIGKHNPPALYIKPSVTCLLPTISPPWGVCGLGILKFQIALCPLSPFSLLFPLLGMLFLTLA